MRGWPFSCASFGLLRLVAAACLALPVLAACGGSSGSSNATLNLGLTDAPVDSASSVVISITGVELQPANGSAITIKFPSPMSIDLLQYQNGNAATLLSGQSIPAGNYSWIRLLLSVGSNRVVANSYVLINNAQYPLIVPSGAQTGLKLVQGFTMTANQVANFTIDFVLSQALTAPPGQTVNGTQAYILQPALRLINNVQAGTISGTVSSTTLAASASCTANYSGTGVLPDAHVYIFSGSSATLTDIQIDPTTGTAPSGHVNPVVTPNISLSSTGKYTYSQPFLLAGPYTLAVACGADDPSTADTLVFLGPNGQVTTTGVQATVTANQTKTVDF